MGRRRVGTVSMAVLLILSGIAIFIGQFNKQSVIDLLVKGWPVILFMLGAEILWYSYKLKDDNFQIKYDLFSIFIITIILLFNIGIYSLVQIDAFTRIDTILSAKDFILQTPVEEFLLDSNIKRIVIDVPWDSEIYTSTENKITAFGTVRVSAGSKEKAEEAIANKKMMITHKEGDTLFVSFNEASGNEGISYYRGTNYTLNIPENKKVEFKNGEEIKLNIDSLKNNWLLDNFYNVNIRLAKNVNLKTYALVGQKENLTGNISWEVKEQVNRIQGEYSSGKGTNKINIINTKNVDINEIY